MCVSHSMSLREVHLDLRSVPFDTVGSATCSNMEALTVSMFRAFGSSRVQRATLSPSHMLTRKAVWALSASLVTWSSLTTLSLDGATNHKASSTVAVGDNDGGVVAADDVDVVTQFEDTNADPDAAACVDATLTCVRLSVQTIVGETGSGLLSAHRR